jgi:hypothetical protein
MTSESAKILDKLAYLFNRHALNGCLTRVLATPSNQAYFLVDTPVIDSLKTRWLQHAQTIEQFENVDIVCSEKLVNI